MRFLVDSSVSRAACDALRNAGHDVLWVPDLFAGDPGDEAVIDRAIETRRILITGDKDFGEWIFLRGKQQPPLIRLSAMAADHQVRVLETILESHSIDLENGALITAGTERLRVRRRLGDKES